MGRKRNKKFLEYEVEELINQEDGECENKSQKKKKNREKKKKKEKVSTKRVADMSPEEATQWKKDFVKGLFSKVQGSQ